MSERALTPAMAAALDEIVVRPVLLMEATFMGETVRFWTGQGWLDWNGEQWAGSADLISVSAIEETDEIKANGIIVTLSGIGDRQVVLALSKLQRGFPGRIWLALLDESGQVIPDPKVMFRGRLDIARLDDEDVENPRLQITYENDLIDFEKPRERRYTDADQRRRDPNDGFFKNVAALQEADAPWGARS